MGPWSMGRFVDFEPRFDRTRHLARLSFASAFAIMQFPGLGVSWSPVVAAMAERAETVPSGPRFWNLLRSTEDDSESSEVR